MKFHILLLFLAAIMIAACSTAEVSQQIDVVENKQLSIGVTFYPYYDLTKEVTEGFADVFSVVPPTTEPHSFNPTAQDFSKLERVDVFVATGVEFESFEDRLISAVSENALIIKASKGIELLDSDGHDHHDHGHEEEMHTDEHHEDEHDTHDEHGHEEETHVDEDDHNHGGTDPHVWLSPNNAIVIATNIATELKETYPEYATQIDANLASIVNELTQLDADYKEALMMCNQDTVLVAHNAYQYLAKDYGFDVIAIGGLSPHSEPTAKQLAELIEEAEYHNISVIYFEELVQPRVAQTIADEVGATTMQLNPVAGSVEEKSYVEIMYDNLDKLEVGLECS